MRLRFARSDYRKMRNLRERGRATLYGCLAVMAGCCGLARAQAPVNVDQADPAAAARVDSYVAREMAIRHLPSVSVAVVQNKKLVFLRAYGRANLEQGSPATPNTVYGLADVTKQFTAAGVLLLVESGKLDLNQKVGHYLPGLPALWSDVTVRHLLTHTSGITSYTDLKVFAEGMSQDLTREQVLKLVANASLYNTPGAGWRFSNTGYFLLGMLLEKVSGKPYEAYLRERIFAPLQMTSTRLSKRQAGTKDVASGYQLQDAQPVPAPYISPSQTFSALGLVSTAVDLAKWDIALNGTKLLTQSSLDLMWSPTTLKSGTRVPYGFGWQLGEYYGHRTAGHAGVVPGFSAQLCRFSQEHTDVVVLTNLSGGGADTLAQAIGAVFIPSLAVVAPDDDLPTTVRLRSLVVAMIQGRAGPGNFTPEAAALLPERVKQAQALQELGPLTSFIRLEAKEVDGLRRLHYRASFNAKQVEVTFSLGKDGKVADVLFARQ